MKYILNLKKNKYPIYSYLNGGKTDLYFYVYNKVIR